MLEALALLEKEQKDKSGVLGSSLRERLIIGEAKKSDSDNTGSSPLFAT